MARRPVLSKYPALLGALRSNANANAEFQKLVTEMLSPVVPAGDDEQLEATRQALKEAQERGNAANTQVAKMLRFIRLLGEIIESQTKLRPYSQDIEQRTEYLIKFTPSQIRMAMKLFWDAVAEQMEAILARNAINDPAADRAEEDE